MLTTVTSKVTVNCATATSTRTAHRLARGHRAKTTFQTLLSRASGPDSSQRDKPSEPT